MTQENPGTDPIANSPGSSPQIEQSILKGVSVDDDLKIEGGITQKVSGERSIEIHESSYSSLLNTGDHNSFNIQPQLPPPLTSTPTNIPYLGAANFVGREDELLELHRLLQQGGRVAITAIAGMGGVGKTELALQYAADHHGDYPAGLCWFSPRALDVSTQILEFAASMRLVPPNDQLFTRLHFIWQHWPKYPESPEGKARVGDVLLVFDDVESFDQVQPFLPIGFQRFKVLLTGRNELGRNIQHLQLDVLPPGKALELLEKFIGKERISKQAQGSADLCDWLGYLPLALELVGQYLADREELSLIAMLSRLQEQRLDDEALQYDEANPDHRTATARRGVATAFELSWQALNAAQRELGCLLSLFAAAAIPWPLVEVVVSLLSEGSTTVEQLQCVRISLVKSHLLQLSEDKESYYLHPLIRGYFGKKLKESGWAEGFKRGYSWAMAKEAVSFSYTSTCQQWERFSLVVPHLVEVADSMVDQVEDDALFYAFLGITSYYRAQGLHIQSELWCRRSIKECKQRLGGEHPNTLKAMGNLAVTLRERGKFTEACSLQEHVLKALNRLLGEEHPLTLAAKNNLAQTLYLQGDLARAHGLFEQVLEISHRVLAEDHPLTLIVISNLAEMRQAQGDLAGSHNLQEQVLAANRRILGEEHPNTLISKNNMALVHHAMGNLEEARSLQEQVLAANRRILGEEHPSTLSLLLSLAHILAAQGDLEGARSQQEQALEAFSRLLGQDHKDTQTAMNNLAQTLYAQGDLSGARSLQEQALETHYKVLGQDHPNTLTLKNNLALTLYAQGDLVRAHSLQEQVLECQSRVLGEEHPSTLLSRFNLAGILLAQGNLPNARSLFEQVLEARSRVLGEEHPDTLAAMNNLAQALHVQGHYEQAEPLYTQALEVLDWCLGSTHPTTQTVWNNYMQFLEELLEERPPALEVLRVSGSEMTREMLQ
jgi:tetratricopeptide (TPR) repeat protein